MEPVDIVEFRLPGVVVRRNFVRHTAILVFLLMLVHLVSRQQAAGALAGAAGLTVLVMAVAYGATARRIWFTLSPAGLASTAYTGRQLRLAWAMPVQVTQARRSGLKGHSVAQQNTGIFKSGAIFIPAAIAAGPEFARCVQAWAPADHPLRTLVAPAA